MRLAAHLLIRASSLPYTIITTRSIRLAKCKIPDFHAYMFIILVRSSSIPIFHCLADIDVFKDPIWDLLDPFLAIVSITSPLQR